VTWDSYVVQPDDMPPNLAWHEHNPSADYQCKLMFAAHTDGTSFRKLKFPDGSELNSRLEYRPVGQVVAP